jgi:hypothetical protein
VAEELVVSLPIRDGALRPLATFVGHPYVQLLCDHCGLVTNLSSQVLGLTGTGK